MQTPSMSDYPAQLKQHWPDARNIRRAGRCPACKADAQWSFQIADTGPVTDMADWEHCGYWCATCGWSNAGAREIEEVA